MFFLLAAAKAVPSATAAPLWAFGLALSIIGGLFAGLLWFFKREFSKYEGEMEHFRSVIFGYVEKDGKRNAGILERLTSHIEMNDRVLEEMRDSIKSIDSKLEASDKIRKKVYHLEEEEKKRHQEFDLELERIRKRVEGFEGYLRETEENSKRKIDEMEKSLEKKAEKENIEKRLLSLEEKFQVILDLKR